MKLRLNEKKFYTQTKHVEARGEGIGIRWCNYGFPPPNRIVKKGHQPVSTGSQNMGGVDPQSKPKVRHWAGYMNYEMNK